MPEKHLLHSDDQQLFRALDYYNFLRDHVQIQSFWYLDQNGLFKVSVWNNFFGANLEEIWTLPLQKIDWVKTKKGKWNCWKSFHNGYFDIKGAYTLQKIFHETENFPRTACAVRFFRKKKSYCACGPRKIFRSVENFLKCICTFKVQYETMSTNSCQIVYHW